MPQGMANEHLICQFRIGHGYTLLNSEANYVLCGSLFLGFGFSSSRGFRLTFEYFQFYLTIDKHRNVGYNKEDLSDLLLLFII
jgi:hypothetical protein